MAPNPAIMQAVEKLNYRVTVGDVATQAGLNLEMANQGLLALATDAGGHLQVADTGDIVYLFPRNFRNVLQSKYFKLRLQQWWNKVSSVLFYLIRISFGIILIASIALITIAITMILTSSDRDDNGGSNFGGGIGFFYFPDLFWLFSPNYNTGYRSNGRRREKSDLNFLEAIFSFLFGDGNPNTNLDERRWQEIATVIRNNDGAVVAEQITPYLDDIGETYQQEYEDYMLPVLAKFNGKPEVSPEGEIVYSFPELQVTAKQKNSQSIPAFLREFSWRFSKATSSQVMLSAGLGGVNLIGALMLGSLLRDGTVASQIGGLVAFAQGIYWLLLAYGIGFLAIPLIRYFWIQQRNKKISDRNRQRQSRAKLIASADEKLQQKINFAHQFATNTVIDEDNLAYSTETTIMEQEIENSAKLDAEWQKRLENGY